MKNTLRLLSPVLLLCAGVQAATLAPPTGLLQIGDSVTNFTLYSVPNSKLYELNVDVRSADFSLTGNATVNQDPWIDYGFALKNYSASAMSFTILLETPFTGGPYQYAKSSHSGSVTDSGGLAPANGNVAVVAAAGGLHQPYVDGMPFGAIAGGCSVAGTSGYSYACGQGNVNGISITTGATGSLALVLSGTLSAGDVYTFNGLASISNLPNDQGVPEPTTVSMALVAFGAAALIRRRMAA